MNLMCATQRLQLGAAICCMMAGCGDTAADSDEGCLEDSCPGVPCGGDPVGTWEIVCVTLNGPTDLGCEGSTLTIDEYCLQGTLTFNADGSGSDVAMGAELTGEWFLPTACLGGQSCKEINEQPTQKGFELSCHETDEGCDCDIAAQITETVTNTLTYTVDGDFLHLIEDGNSTDVGFCADETSLWLGSDTTTYKLRRL